MTRCGGFPDRESGPNGEWWITQDEAESIAGSTEELTIVFHRAPHIRVRHTIRRSPIEKTVVLPSTAPIQVTCVGLPEDASVWSCTVTPIRAGPAGAEPLLSTTWTRPENPDIAAGAIECTGVGRELEPYEELLFDGLLGESYQVLAYVPALRLSPGSFDVQAPGRVEFRVEGPARGLTVVVRDPTGRPSTSHSGTATIAEDPRASQLFHGIGTFPEPVPTQGEVTVLLDDGRLLANRFDRSQQDTVDLWISEGRPPVVLVSEQCPGLVLVEHVDGSVHPLYMNPLLWHHGRGTVRLGSHRYGAQPGTVGWNRLWVVGQTGHVRTVESGTTTARLDLQGPTRSVDFVDLWDIAPDEEGVVHYSLEVRFGTGDRGSPWFSYATGNQRAHGAIEVPTSTPPGVLHRISGTLHQETGYRPLRDSHLR